MRPLRLLRLLGPVTILVTASLPTHAQVWIEDFESAAETTSGTSGGSIPGTWTTTSGSGSFNRLDASGFGLGGIFYINGTVTERVWQSNAINISALGDVALEITVGGLDAISTDYVRAYYKINGGPEIMFAEAIGAPGLNEFNAASAIVSGNTLQIVVRGLDNSGGANPARAMGFDDVTVTDISILYSRRSADWGTPSTWSTTGFSGTPCGCTPDADTRVIIGGGFTVDLSANGTAAGLEIRNTGTLRWTSNNRTLTIARGGSVDIQSGGVLTRVATTGSAIAFGNYTYNINVSGTLSIGAMAFTGSGNSTITNSGSVTLATATGLLITGGNGYTFNNSGTFGLTSMDLNNADITFNNSGIVNQTGNFTDVDNGSRFNNLAGSTWNFGGTTVTNVRLFASNNSNTFNYNGAAQSIITPQDAYSNLILSGSGAKTALADFSVRGNWTRSGSATFAPGTRRVTLSGDIQQNITATPGETFSNLTINNTSATSPQIVLHGNVTASTNLTMTDGNVNLNGNTFTISGTLIHSMASTAGWMYDGNITRAFASATAITVGTVAGYFPLGSSGDSRPFWIGKDTNGSSGGTLTVQHNDASTATDVNFPDGAATIQRRHDSFWSLSKTGMTAGTFSLRAGGTGYGVTNAAHVRLTRATDATGIGTSAAGSLTGGVVLANRTGVPATGLANDFYIASTNASASPLPVELEWFRASIQGDEVITTWKTAQEKNNHFFTIEKTVDFETFYEVGTIDGQGTTSEEHSYSFIDDSPIKGRSYYRLKQTDFDGAFSFSAPVMIDYGGPKAPFLKAYPNPSDGRAITLEIKGVTGLQVVDIHLYNQQGEKVLEIPVSESAPGEFKTEVVFRDRLRPGMYIAKAGKTLQLVSKIVVY